jgi:hypothetical protein
LDRCVAIATVKAHHHDDLPLHKGDIIELLEVDREKARIKGVLAVGKGRGKGNSDVGRLVERLGQFLMLLSMSCSPKESVWAAVAGSTPSTFSSARSPPRWVGLCPSVLTVQKQRTAIDDANSQGSETITSASSGGTTLPPTPSIVSVASIPSGGSVVSTGSGAAGAQGVMPMASEGIQRMGSVSTHPTQQFVMQARSSLLFLLMSFFFSSLLALSLALPAFSQAGEGDFTARHCQHHRHEP